MAYIIFGDGGSRGNPGKSASGWAIFEVESISWPKNRDQASAITNSINSEPVSSSAKYLGITTNNVAEWSALIYGLEEVLKFGNSKNDSKIEVLALLDSELVCKQVQGIYKVKQPHLIPLSLQVKNLVTKFAKFQVAHIFREDNKLADSMVNQCLDSL